MTIKDIARESGYAVGTVSRVLNHHPNVSAKAREQVMEVVEKYHFRLNSNAKHLKQSASNGLAIIVKGSQNMLFAAVLEQMQGLIQEKGYPCHVRYINEEENELESAAQLCRERRPLGIFFLGSNKEYFRGRFSEIEVPCVLVTNSASELGSDILSSVSTDDEKAAEAAVNYLIGLGHRRIGILGGNRDSQAANTRCCGCRRAFEQHHMEFSYERQYEEALFSMEEGYRAMLRLLDKLPGMTAVFAMSDVMAVGALRAIRDRGLAVPDDISVMGFDGIELGKYLTPKLSTVRQAREKIAVRSVEILLANINGESGAVHELVPFEIIQGESTGQTG